jgi:hypothetical protein
MTFFLAAVGIVAAMSRYVLRHDIYVRFTNLLYGHSATVNHVPRYSQYPYMTFFHVVPGSLFMLLGLLQFTPQIRGKYPEFHRLCGKIFIVTGIISLIVAFLIVAKFPLGGMNEIVPTILFGLIFAYCVFRAYWYARKKRFGLHREWVIRTFGLGLGISSIRIFFFALQHLFGLSDYENIGISFWLGFSINLMIAEVWINYSRMQRS